MQINDKVKFLGQITEGTIKLGDLTVLVGPNAIKLRNKRERAFGKAVVSKLKSPKGDW
jgi:hypothetical protein